MTDLVQIGRGLVGLGEGSHEAVDPLLRDDPRRDIAVGAAVSGLFLIAVFGWGLWAHLDAAVFAPGQVEVAGERQSVQHRDGGIVSELDAHEGQRVAAGQVLLKLNTDELGAQLRSDSDQVIALEAMEARLSAELQGHAFVDAPADFATLDGDERASAEAALALQRREFAVRGAALSSERDVLLQKDKESSQQITGYQRQVSASQEQQTLIGQEIDSLKDLYAKGLVPATRLRSLQRTSAELRGGEGEYSADIARTREEIGESRIRAADLTRERDADDSKAMQEAEFQLAELRPKQLALRQQIERATVRAPAAGRVVGLAVFTVGGVVAPGQKLMDVVPEHQPMVIQARVKPSDATDLKIGQKVELRIGAFHDRGLPSLHGRISEVSADSFFDDKTGASYYRIEVAAPPSELARIEQARGGLPGVKPGLPVEVIIPLRPRTALGYLIEPLRQVIWRSFREP